MLTFILYKQMTFFGAGFFSVPAYLFTVSSVSSPFSLAMNTPAPCPFFKYLFQISQYGFLFSLLVLLHFH